MLIYIRHSKDRYNDRHPYDGYITSGGKRIAKEKAQSLARRYGIPDVIFCSPFRRTRGTLKSMLKQLVKKYGRSSIDDIKIIYHPSLSRYFTSKERLNPLLAESTEAHGVPIGETKEELYDRVRTLSRKLDRKFSKSDEICWVITHTVPYKIINKYHGRELPKRIPFMHSTVIR